MEKKKEEETKRLEENTNWLHRVENEMRLLGQDGRIPQVNFFLSTSLPKVRNV